MKMSNVTTDFNTHIIDNNQLLDDLNKEKIKEYAPVIAYVSIVIVLGIFGNVMTVMFYGFKKRKTTNTVLITTLAAIDLITSIIISDEIIELCFSITFKNVIGCKFMHFIKHWFVSLSVLVLWIICIDRYRKVCKHFSWQFSMATIKITFASATVFTFIMAVPGLVELDIARVNVTDRYGNVLLGYYCTHSKDEAIQKVTTVFHILDLIVLIAVTVTFVILYSIIGRVIYVSRKSIKHGNKNKPNRNLDSKVNDGAEETVFDETTVNDEHSMPEGKDIKQNAIERKKRLKKVKFRNPKAAINAETRITLIMITITIGYMVSFIPYFVVNLAIKPGSESSEEFSVGIQLALRSFLLNCAINPYIIGVYNPIFRRFVKYSLCRCWMRASISESSAMWTTTVVSAKSDNA